MTQDREPAGADAPHWHVELTATVHSARCRRDRRRRQRGPHSVAGAVAEAARTLRGALADPLRLRGPVRLAAPAPDRLMPGAMTPQTAAAVRDYHSPVPLFASGAEAAAHGVRELDEPGPQARTAIAEIELRRARNRTNILRAHGPQADRGTRPPGPIPRPNEPQRRRHAP